MKSSFKTVALIGKYKSPEVVAPLLKLARFLERRKVEVLMGRIDGSRAGRVRYPILPLEELGRRADLAIVIGGDGTMLNIARTFAPYNVALVGINQGRVGFMTDIGHNDMQSGIGAILDGRYTLEERTLLDAEVIREHDSVLRTVALNEAVVGKGAQGRLIEFDLSLDGEFVYTLRADGVIVATPTGSTAYAMSAQGPILHPAVPALALVPLNPHTLSARPVSVTDRSVIEIVLVRAMDARAHFDGFALTDMAEGDRLVLKRSADTVRFVHPPGYRYFATLREKLRWSETLDRDRDEV